MQLGDCVMVKRFKYRLRARWSNAKRKSDFIERIGIITNVFDSITIESNEGGIAKFEKHPVDPILYTVHFSEGDTMSFLRTDLELI